VAVAHFKPAEEKEKDEDDLKPVGGGTALGEIDAVKEAIDKRRSDDDTLTKIHGICYGKGGQKQSRKKNLRAFNGFADVAEAEAKVRRGCPVCLWDVHGSTIARAFS
jgi:hypothetical protein